MKFFQLAVAGFLCSLSALSVAEDPEPKLSFSVPSTTAVGDTELRVFLREEGARLHKHFVLHPKAPQTIDIGGIPVKNISAAQLVPILRPLVPVWGHLAALPDRNALILVDRSGNVRRLVEIIKILENLPKAPEVAPAAKSP